MSTIRKAFEKPSVRSIHKDRKPVRVTLDTICQVAWEGYDPQTQYLLLEQDPIPKRHYFAKRKPTTIENQQTGPEASGNFRRYGLSVTHPVLSSRQRINDLFSGDLVPMMVRRQIFQNHQGVRNGFKFSPLKSRPDHSYRLLHFSDLAKGALLYAITTQSEVSPVRTYDTKGNLAENGGIAQASVCMQQGGFTSIRYNGFVIEEGSSPAELSYDFTTEHSCEFQRNRNSARPSTKGRTRHKGHHMCAHEIAGWYRVIDHYLHQDPSNELPLKWSVIPLVGQQMQQLHDIFFYDLVIKSDVTPGNCDFHHPYQGQIDALLKLAIDEFGVQNMLEAHRTEIVEGKEQIVRPKMKDYAWRGMQRAGYRVQANI